MTARLIDGKAIAAGVVAAVAEVVATLKHEHRLQPGLATVLVGDHPASQTYVRNKIRQSEAAGLRSFAHHLPPDVSERELLTLVLGLNRNPDVNGILVQLPLPPQIDPDAVLSGIDPEKDVDGFHVVNAGRLVTGSGRALVPCTPSGCLMLIRSVRPDPTGLHAVVVGRSNIVGKPMAHLLLDANCTVTIAHSKTVDLPGVCRTADVLVAAVGRPRMIAADWVKPGAVVIDVGINRIVDATGRGRLVGDVDFEAALAVAGAITPVPGGVGPMTVACLLRNTVIAACRQHRLEDPEIF